MMKVLIPGEIIQHIYIFLNVKHVYNGLLINKHYYYSLIDESFWFQNYQQYCLPINKNKNHSKNKNKKSYYELCKEFYDYIYTFICANIRDTPNIEDYAKDYFCKKYPNKRYELFKLGIPEVGKDNNEHKRFETIKESNRSRIFVVWSNSAFNELKLLNEVIYDKLKNTRSILITLMYSNSYNSIASFDRNDGFNLTFKSKISNYNCSFNKNKDKLLSEEYKNLIPCLVDTKFRFFSLRNYDFTVIDGFKDIIKSTKIDVRYPKSTNSRDSVYITSNKYTDKNTAIIAYYKNEREIIPAIILDKTLNYIHCNFFFINDNRKIVHNLIDYLRKRN